MCAFDESVEAIQTFFVFTKKHESEDQTMKKIIKAVVVAATLAVAATVHGFSLPLVGTGTELNKWTRNMSGVLAAAKTTGYPIFLVMINDSSSGEGCSLCKLFVERTLNTGSFEAVVKEYKFYLVLLNYWGIEHGTSQPNYGGVPYSTFWPVFQKYRSTSGFPAVAVIRPNGEKYKGWGDTTNPSSRYGLSQYIRQAIADLQPKKDTTFNLSAESGNTVSVQVDGTAVKSGTWKGVITRNGESGTTGSVAISLSGANAAHYRVNPASIAWDSKDGSKSFTVTGPSSSNGGLVSDTITVTIRASGFDGTDISYKTSSQVVTFKDSRVKQSLAEFAETNNGLKGLVSAGGTWFVPAAGGNALETLTASSSTLDFTATLGGILTVEAGANDPGTMTATVNGTSHDLAVGQTLRFGVAPNQKIVFKATVRDGTATSIGFKKFSFSPLNVTLKTPANGAQIQYGEMMADKTKVDLSWSAGRDGCTFAVTCGGVTVDMGNATSANALDIGFVSNDLATVTYTWEVKANYTNANLVGTAVGTAKSSFTVAALPSFSDIPATIAAYKSVNAGIDLSVTAVGAGTVEYSAKGLPAGLKIDKKTGMISGTPRRAGSYNVTVTAKSSHGDVSKSFAISVATFPKSYTKATYLCFRFSDADDVEASVTVKLQAAGKWKATFAEGTGTSSKNGTLLTNRDGALVIASGKAFNIVFDKTSKIWSGTWNGRRVYGKATDRADAKWKGTWNSGVGSSAAVSRGGWVTAKVVASGQITFTGSISNKAKISGKGYSVVFPASFIAMNLPKWAGHGDVRFVYMGKVVGGYAFCADGVVGGRFKLQGVTYDEIEGSKWSGGSLENLDGATLVTSGGGDVEIPIVVNGNKLAAGNNEYKAQITVILKSGRVSVSYVNDGRGQASGVLYKISGALKAVGGGFLGAGTFKFVIE